jgi:chromosomal replication initiator protein
LQADRLTPREAWEIARSQLRLQMTKGTYETWIRDTVCLASEDNAFVIGCPNAYTREWLSIRLRSLIKKTLVSIVGHAVEVSFIVMTTPLADVPGSPAAGPLLNASSAAEPDDGAGFEAPGSSEKKSPAGLIEVPGVVDMPIIEGGTFNPRYTFENFIVGPSNRMAHAVAMSVAERPGRAYNPLFMYGGVGLGKTHLLQAIGHSLQPQGHRVLYVSSELFTNEMISAIRTGSTEQFRAKYRQVDVLLIDDVQFIAGKEQTQEEFFHTFNALHSANRQIVMTSDRAPQAIPTLEERLRSRFAWGMIADIQSPGLETRIAILQAKADSIGVQVPDDVLTLIAQRAHRNIRDLEGALNRVIAHAQILNKPLNVGVVEDALAYLQPTQSKLSLETILDIAAQYFGISVADLTGRSRNARIALQRQIVMYIMREETGASLPQVGEALGGRDHTTVMHGYERVASELDNDAELHRQVAELRERLYQPARTK